MTSKFQNLFDRTIKKLDENNQVDMSQFDPRQNKADISNRRVADYSEPKDRPRQRDPETPDYNTPTGMYAVRGPFDMERPSKYAYYDVITGEMLYSIADAPSSGIHKTTDKEAAKKTAEKLNVEKKDLVDAFIRDNRAWAKPDHKPFAVVQFFKK